ncbi:LysR family transcriptional regulator [Gordoniibacillus kamchatkensis]|uniref:LysR family transcriptional regulator n=1 Tax=Gordoniibacillus kamchatkensis TaxID=1590651 RepID=UPI001E62B7C6|nr:LysR family transcriptional regulator [Paenibacillus sp. VKM B-2647]
MEYFVAVCEELHFSKAAEKLGISQPNLSLQIKALEAHVGLPLFERIGKRTVLTDAGAVLLKHCRSLFTNLQNAYDEIGELRDFEGCQLAVGVIPSELDYRLTPLFIDFLHQFPKNRLRLYSTVEVVKLVLDMAIDIGITLNPAPDHRLRVRPLAKEAYGLIVSDRHELADRESISLAELKGLPMIMYPKGYWGRELVEKYCRDYGFELDTVVETTSNPSLFRFVRENIGATVQTYPLAKAINDPKLRFIKIEDHPPVRETSIVHRADKYLGRAAQSFIRLAEQQLK